MAIEQSAHFFDRVPASDAAAAPIRKAYVFRNPVTGRYVLSDTLPLGVGEVPAYFVEGASDRYHLDSDPAGARTAALYSDNVVEL